MIDYNYPLVHKYKRYKIKISSVTRSTVSNNMWYIVASSPHYDQVIAWHEVTLLPIWIKEGATAYIEAAHSDVYANLIALGGIIRLNNFKTGRNNFQN